MAIKIEKIDMTPEDTLLIYFKGSAEVSLAIVADNNGIKISGPCNRKERTFFLPKNCGPIEEIEKKEV